MTLGDGTDTLFRNVVYELTNQEDIISQLHPGKAENLTNYVVKERQLFVLCNGHSVFAVRYTLNILRIIFMYRISRPIRRTFFPEKCGLNLTCVLCAEGKYYFQTYKYLYSYYTTPLCEIVKFVSKS
jgi:hypothetical protein